MEASYNILVIEDDTAVARGLRDGLESNGFHVTWKASGEEGIQFASSQQPHRPGRVQKPYHALPEPHGPMAQRGFLLAPRLAAKLPELRGEFRHEHLHNSLLE